MRHFLICLAALCAVVALVVMGTRLSSAEQASQAEYTARFSAACEAMEQLTAGLETAAVCPADALPAETLIAIARSSNTARTQLAALPLPQETAAIVTSALNEVTQQADAQLCALMTGNSAQLSALLHHQALCERLCAQLLLINESLHAGGSADSALTTLSEAVCCDGEHAAQIPIPTYAPPLGLPDRFVDREEAMQLASSYVSGDVLRLTSAPDAGGALPSYGFTADTQDLRLQLEITQQGGQLLWMMPETADFPQRCTLADCRSAVRVYLAAHGFGAMQEVAWQVYDGLFMAAMAPVDQQVLLYPDLIHVQVRMDTGEVVGFEAAQYWTHHTDRDFPLPRLSADSLTAALDADATLVSTVLCLLPVDGAELLCHQLCVSRGGERFLLFFSAEDGHPVAAKRLFVTENGVFPA